jgi:hypothetical protein
MNKRGTYMNNQHAGMTHEEATALAQEMEAFYEAADPFNRTVAFNVIAKADGTYGVLASDAQESWTINKAAWEAGRAERAAFLASRREEKEQEAHIQRDRAARLERRRLWFPGEDHAPGWADLLAGFVNLSGEGTDMAPSRHDEPMITPRAACLRRHRHPSDLVPDLESLLSLSAVLLCPQAVPPRAEVLPDRPECREESLGLAR